VSVPSAVPLGARVRQVAEWAFYSPRAYANPFADVDVEGVLTDPAGVTYQMPAFYDGQGIWRLRFSPSIPGDWQLSLRSSPHDPALCWEGRLQVGACEARGLLRAVPGTAWGLAWENGEPALVIGDTTYNLFGMAHCGLDVKAFMQRRVQQGINLLRVRVPVSPFHPPEGYSAWQERRTWPWGGSEQAPQFDRFNLDYFHTVDAVVQEAERLGLGLEMIMEAWGFEFPFSQRQLFVPEWEQLWMRYLVARYDAYSAVAIWTLMNEYEFYPDGDWRHNPVADRWALRMGRWLKGIAPHGHIVALHNGPELPPFAQRLQRDPEAIDLILYQSWGTRDAARGWLAAEIEDRLQASLEGWGGASLLAEWGYERNERFPLLIPSHAHCDGEHTRRGAWRGLFMARGIIHGFENSWGPFADLEHDQQGLAYLLVARRFFNERVPFAHLQPAPELLAPLSQCPGGYRPLALATPARDIILVYLPAGGEVCLPLPGSDIRAAWFSPVDGSERPAVGSEGSFRAPSVSFAGHPQDWILIIEERR
jgi:hypothetical protein